MQIITKVKEYIREKSLLTDNSKVIVGVSGGADSMALLHILIQLGYDCIAAHCNFHLRGEESDRDYLFVKNYCLEKNIQFVHTDFDTKAYMNEQLVSLEMAARELRYSWFEQIRKKYEADAIAVAHHQDDSVETVLINLIRGTGIRGLTGIPPANGYIVRPLLCLFQTEILEYLDVSETSYVTDSTNNENVYVRNKIRLDVIPLLKTINPAAVQSIAKTANHLAAAESIYSKAIEDAKSKLLHNNRIDIVLLKQQSEPLTILFEILHPYGFNIDTVENLFNSLDGISGKTFYSAEYRIIKDRNTLILERSDKESENSSFIIYEESTSVDKPVSLTIEHLKSESLSEIEKNSRIIYIDKDKISFPLTIRRWKNGDRFTPFGMNGSKKVSDFFTDQKYSLTDKENAWLLCSDNKIVWIIGKRADNRFRITDKTTEIVKITLNT